MLSTSASLQWLRDRLNARIRLYQRRMVSAKDKDIIVGYETKIRVLKKCLQDVQTAMSMVTIPFQPASSVTHVAADTALQ